MKLQVWPSIFLVYPLGDSLYSANQRHGEEETPVKTLNTEFHGDCPTSPITPFDETCIKVTTRKNNVDEQTLDLDEDPPGRRMCSMVSGPGCAHHFA